MNTFRIFFTGLILILSHTIKGQIPSISYAQKDYTFYKDKSITTVNPVSTGGAVPNTAYSLVSTFAGSGSSGSSDGAATTATFRYPLAVAVNAAGDVFVGDEDVNTIRKISKDGQVSTYSYGFDDGSGNFLNYNSPVALAIDKNGTLYIADRDNHTIKKITSVGVGSVLAGSGIAGSANGQGREASFNFPEGIAVDGDGNVYVSDRDNNKIRKISPTGLVSTLAGTGTAGYADGPAASANFKTPKGIAVDGDKNLYVADYGNSLIRKISAAGEVTTVAGGSSWSNADGIKSDASFSSPFSVAIDVNGDIYVGESARIRKISPNGVVNTVAGNSAGFSGTDGIGTAASFWGPIGICLDYKGSLFIASNLNKKIRKLSLTGYTASPALPAGLSLNSGTGQISGTPTGSPEKGNYTITAVNAYGSSSYEIGITVLVSPPGFSYTSNSYSFLKNQAISEMTLSHTGGSIIPYAQVSTLAGQNTYGFRDGRGSEAAFNSINAIACDSDGNVYESDDKKIRKITPSGLVTAVSGQSKGGYLDGNAAEALYSSISALAFNSKGELYIAETNRIRKLGLDGLVSTVAGTGVSGNADGVGTAASFKLIKAIAFDKNDNLFIADYGDNKIRKLNVDGTVSTYAGTGVWGSKNGSALSAEFNYPDAITADRNGNVFVGEGYSIRIITTDGVVANFAGDGGTGGNKDGVGTSAQFNNISALTYANDGNIYVINQAGGYLRRVSGNAVVTTIAGGGSTSSGNGVDGRGNAASFGILCTAITTDKNGNIYTCERFKVRKVSTGGYFLTGGLLPAGLSFNDLNGTISGTPAEVFEKQDYSVVASNEGGNYTVDFSIAVANALPVTLEKFTAFRVLAGVELDWISAVEVNSESYTIKHSGDGTNFSILGQLKSKEQAASYSFIDNVPRQGINYYQLLHTDKDGSVKNLGIRTVSLNLAKPSGLSIYPNPLTGRSLQLGLADHSPKLISVSMVDMNGNIVFEKKVKASSTMVFDLDKDLNPGVYIIKAGTESGKVVVE